ncbi:LOG family protein [Actinoplanes sp. OR16]|uniref:SLOG cluster 4 domain-containing protein n=1 Tax=Actinoplanes sp. OR16 TaxID=946334 RepID=UPI001E359948|nr:LOG family protein [Actinoplanes sp. OR16]
MVALHVAVCGPRECTDAEAALARRVGELLAARQAVVICGGGGGVMAAVAAGVRARDGLVIGIRPGDGSDGADGADGGDEASPDLSATIVTNMGEARNAIIVQSADAVISVGGSWGTLSEVALAVRRGGIPVIALGGGWRVVDADGVAVPGIDQADTPEEAVGKAMAGRG